MKLKPIFPQFVIPGAIALTLAVGASVPPANAGWLERLGTALIDLFAKLGAFLAGVLADIVLPFLTGITKNLIDNPNLPIGADAKGLWDVAITLANSFFLLALILASIAIMLRVNTGTYNIKKVLGGFISAVVLSNLSFLVVGAMLDIGNALLNAVYVLLATGKESPMAVIQSLAAIGGASQGQIWENHLEATIVFIVMVVLVIWVILSIAALLVERLIWLFLLTISAPVVFALSLLPTLNKLASGWWEQMIKWVIAFPYSIALLVIAGKIMGLGEPDKEDLGQLFQKFAEAVNKQPDAVGSAIATMIDQNMILMICGMVVIYFAGRVPKMLKIGGVLTGITGGGPGSTWGAIKKGGEGAFRGVSNVVAGKGLAGWAQKRARGTVGGALNLATGWIKPETKLGRLPIGWGANLGTQLGSLPSVWFKSFAATGKARELKTGTSAREKIGKIAGFISTKGLGGVSKAILSGEVGEIYKEIVDQTRSTPALEDLKKSIREAKDPFDLVIQMGKANRLIGQPGVPQLYKRDLKAFIDEYKYKDEKNPGFEGNKQQQSWNKLRTEIKPLSLLYWDSDAEIPGPAIADTEAGGEGTPAGGATRIPSAATDKELRLAQSKAQLTKSRGELTKQLATLRLEDQDAAALADSTVIDNLSKSPAAQAAIGRLNPEILDALARHEDGSAIMEDLAEGRAMGKTQLRADIPAVTEDEIEALVTVARETHMSPPDVRLAGQLNVGARRGSVTLGELMARLKPNLDQARATQQEVENLSAQISTAAGADIEQNYREAVEVLIQDRVKKNSELTVDAARETIHTEANNVYEQLVSKVGEIADVTDDSIVGKTMDQNTQDNLNKFFGESGELGTGMTGPTLNNARLSSVLQRVRLIRDHTKSEQK